MSRQSRLCRYAYDPLDRLASRAQLADEPLLDFYQVDRLATQIQGSQWRSFVYHDRQFLAQHTLVGKLAATALSATDSQYSVLHADEAAIAYAPYGHRDRVMALPGLPGFNGQQPDPVTGHYLLGNGYRAYNPALMRFNSPDSLSPFGKGGLNAYAYCGGDPVNRSDPSGHEVDTRQLLSYVWIGLGLFGAVWGVKAAMPALKAIHKDAATTAAAVTEVRQMLNLGFKLSKANLKVAHPTGATHAQQLAGRSAVSQVVASTLFTASGVLNAVEPDTPKSTFLLAIAIGIAIPTVPARIRASSLTSSAAKKADQGASLTKRSAPAGPIQPNRGSRASSIRSGTEVTRL